MQQIYDRYFPKKTPKVTPPDDFADRAGDCAGNYTFWCRNFSTIEKALASVNGGIDVVPIEDNPLSIKV